MRRNCLNENKSRLQKMCMKNWLSNIVLFTSLFLFTPLVLSGAENDIHSKEASFSISREDGQTITKTKNSDSLIRYNIFLSKLSDCLLEKELLERMRVPRLSFQEHTIAIYKKLFCIKWALLPETILKESYSNNHTSYVEMLFNRKYYIYGRKQILI